MRACVLKIGNLKVSEATTGLIEHITVFVFLFKFVDVKDLRVFVCVGVAVVPVYIEKVRMFGAFFWVLEIDALVRGTGIGWADAAAAPALHFGPREDALCFSLPSARLLAATGEWGLRGCTCVDARVWMHVFRDEEMGAWCRRSYRSYYYSTREPVGFP